MPPFNTSRALALARAQLFNIPRARIPAQRRFTHDLVSSSRPKGQTMTAYEQLQLLRHDSASTRHDFQYRMEQLEERLETRDGKLEILDHRMDSLKYKLSSTESRLTNQLSDIKHEIWKLSSNSPRTTYPAPSSCSCSIDEGRIVVILWVTIAIFLSGVCILAELRSQEERCDKQERERKARGEVRSEK